MTTDLRPDARPTSPLMGLTRVLAGMHILAGVGCLGIAAYALLEYQRSAPDEMFAALGLIVGAGAALLGLLLIVLGTGVCLARTAMGAYVCALTASLVLLFAVRAAGWWMLTGIGAVIGGVAGLVALVLLVCAVVGLATRRA